MALINCPECGKSISDQAKKCIHCGCPLEKSTAVNSVEAFLSSSAHDTDSNRQDANVKISHNLKNKRKKEITFAVIGMALIILAIVLIIAQKEKDTQKSNTQTSYEDLESVKEKLISNTEYVKEHIIGTWRTSDGRIQEIYSNGFMVNYTPQQNENLDAESFILSEIKSTGYNGYTIPDVSSYSESNLRNYSAYLERLRNTDKIGITIQLNFYGVLEDKYVLFEFQGDDRLAMGDIVLTRVEAEEPIISDGITGCYVNEADKTLSLQVININNTNIGYFEWVKGNNGTDGSCSVSNDKIVLTFPYADDFVFKRQDACLLEIGSKTIQGSNLRYEKISSLSYFGQVKASQISVSENNSEDNSVSEEYDFPDSDAVSAGGVIRLEDLYG